MLLPLHTDDGRPLQAHITLEGGPDVWSIIFESRGGILGTKTARNPGYAAGLRTVLARLQVMDSVLLDALVASREVATLPDQDRRVAGFVFPINLAAITDIDSLAVSLQRGQREVGAAKGAKGGNTTKRMLLKIAPALMLTFEQMAARLTRAVAMGHVESAELDEAGHDLDTEGRFNPHGESQGRRRVMRAIADRQGQPAFRRRVLNAYDRKCAITGCALERLLDAAHILPYQGPATNHVQNGLLLRTDLHTLFDLGLVAVDPATWRVVTHAELSGTEYGALDGREVRLPAEAKHHPSSEALGMHLQAAGLGVAVWGDGLNAVSPP